MMSLDELNKLGAIKVDLDKIRTIQGGVCRRT